MSIKNIKSNTMESITEIKTYTKQADVKDSELVMGWDEEKKKFTKVKYKADNNCFIPYPYKSSAYSTERMHRFEKIPKIVGGEHKEYHTDGNLAFEETIQVIDKDKEHLYEWARVYVDGTHWIRVGRCAKYHKNGQLNWELNYDESGMVIAESNPMYREDGTVITF